MEPLDHSSLGEGLSQTSWIYQQVPEGESLMCSGLAPQDSPSRDKDRKREGLPRGCLVGSLSQKWIRQKEMKDDLAGIRD